MTDERRKELEVLVRDLMWAAERMTDKMRRLEWELDRTGDELRGIVAIIDRTITVLNGSDDGTR